MVLSPNDASGFQSMDDPDLYPGAEHKRSGPGAENETKPNVGTTLLRFAPGYESGPSIPSHIQSTAWSERAVAQTDLDSRPGRYRKSSFPRRFWAGIQRLCFGRSTTLGLKPPDCRPALHYWRRFLGYYFDMAFVGQGRGGALDYNRGLVGCFEIG